MSTRDVISRFRQPEYTGENRCAPCTVVNVLIAAAVSVLVGIVSVPIAVVIFSLLLGMIYVRGYLVPGTPTLTKTYFPDRVLRWFDKESTPEYDVFVEEADTDFDSEVVLLSVDALAESRHADDLRLTPGLQEEWHREMDRLDESAAKRLLVDGAGIAPDRISAEQKKRFYIASVDEYRLRDRVLSNYRLGQWESSAAFVADMAAGRVLERRIENWSDLPGHKRSELQRSLRVFLEQCPECDGSVSVAEETVESCCRSRQVLVNRCQDCGTRLFEIDAAKVENREP